MIYHDEHKEHHGVCDRRRTQAYNLGISARCCLCFPHPRCRLQDLLDNGEDDD